ncbi:putative Perakine reductase [Blattamonas nauphoetae]|uniref:Perakine reductase n=1 Tax=Blattamonas nauphoetae TaxID=2049346 RepID=A0ABQ9X0T3_9EUKA|nr:putative Perakine reductase [Blattamonas nauphoetae]
METRKLGNLEVSAVGMGCMAFSHGYGEVPSEEYAIEAIRKAYEAGCTFFDTAEIYGKEQFFPGHNEILVGKAIAPFRGKVVLATKLFIQDADYENGADLFTSIKGHLEKSLKNLQTNYVDLYYLHRVHESVAIEDVARVMGQLISEGLIRGWGLSQVGKDLIARAHAMTPVTAVQNLYSMMERDCEKEVLPFLLANNIGLVPFSPIASGFLSGKITKETAFSEVDDVRKFVPQLSKENIEANQWLLNLIGEVAAKYKATNAQISLAWMLKKYPNVVPIPGSKNQERILENLGGGKVKLSDEDFKRLEEGLNAREIAGHRGIEETQHKSFGDNWSKK